MTRAPITEEAKRSETMIVDEDLSKYRQNASVIAFSRTMITAPQSEESKKPAKSDEKISLEPHAPERGQKVGKPREKFISVAEMLDVL